LEIVAQGSGRGHKTTYRLRKGTTEFGETQKGETPSDETPNVEQSDTSIKNRIEPSNNLEDQFEKFWKKYPRKVAKVAARNVFVSIMKKKDAPSLDRILEAVDKYAASGVELKYVAHPATWLRQGRWEDEPEEVKATPAPKDWHLDQAYDRVVPFARLGYSWDECLDAIRDFEPRVIEPCREIYEKIINGSF
jgi:hypothetical protein